MDTELDDASVADAIDVGSDAGVAEMVKASDEDTSVLVVAEDEGRSGSAVEVAGLGDGSVTDAIEVGSDAEVAETVKTSDENTSVLVVAEDEGRSGSTVGVLVISGLTDELLILTDPVGELVLSASEMVLAV